MKKAKIKINPEDLVTIKQASIALGKGYSRSSMLRRINTGEWQEGIHYIDDARMDSKLRNIKINLTAVQEQRSIPAGKR
jgi:hypothetical protein